MGSQSLPIGAADRRGAEIPRQEDVPWEHLHERIGWLIRLRTIAVATALPLLAAAGLAGVLSAVPQLLALAAGLGLYNIHCWYRWRSTASGAVQPLSARQLEQSIFRQLLFDLVVLTLLLHFGGGVQNPFAAFYSFHMAIGAMLLHRRSAFALGAVAALCYGAIVLGELTGLIPHHLVRIGAIGTPWRVPTFVLWRYAAVCVTNFGTLYFVSSVAERYRRAEALRHEHDRVAASRERLVRIGEVAAGVAHSVRNPLHGLLNGVEILAARVSTDTTSSETLALMNEALQRIDQVTRRLLVLSRDAPLALAPVDLDALAQDAITLASPRARGSKARVDFHPGGSGTVEVDALRVSEALVNVIDNALDACKGGGTVSVRTSPSETDASIEVADTGPGIPRDDLERVFDPFFTTKAVGEGSGLGLAIARRTVEEHGGSVTIDSSPGGGTKVRLSIPRQPVQGVS